MIFHLNLRFRFCNTTMADDSDVPGAFAKKHRSGHVHTQNCSHPLVQRSGTLDVCAASQVLNALPASLERFMGAGTLKTSISQGKTTVLQVLMPPEVASGKVQGLIGPLARLFGVSASTVNFGIKVRGSKSSEKMNSDLVNGIDVWRMTRADYYDRMIVYNYFKHIGDGPDFCPLVEPDKSKLSKWKGKEHFVGKTCLTLTCSPHVRRGNIGELVEDYRESETCSMWAFMFLCFKPRILHFVLLLVAFFSSRPRRYEARTKLSISDPQIAQCVCPCIRPETIKDCACPICVDAECEIRAVRENLGCKTCEGGDWCKAVVSTSAFARAVSCPDAELAGMERRGSNEPFRIRQLECCVSIGEVPGVLPCANCTMEARLPIGQCQCFSEASLSRNVTWLKRQDTVEGKNCDRVLQRLRSYSGPLGDLIKSLRARAKPLLHHLWRARFLRRQFHLDCDNLSENEAIFLADFASAMVLGAGFKSTCESDSTCSLYVVLVLYKAGGETKCDYVRFWSSAVTSAEFHHHAMRVVVDHLKEGKVPGLLRVRPWTDGHGSTYRGYVEAGGWRWSQQSSAAYHLL